MKTREAAKKVLVLAGMAGTFLAHGATWDETRYVHDPATRAEDSSGLVCDYGIHPPLEGSENLPRRTICEIGYKHGNWRSCFNHKGFIVASFRH